MMTISIRMFSRDEHVILQVVAGYINLVKARDDAHHASLWLVILNA